MKTKLTLLLALAVSASANAEKPNFNGFKPAQSASAPRAAPSYSGGGSSRSFNPGQAIGIARSLLPLVMNATPPPPPRPSAVKRSPSPAVTTNKPATRSVSKPATVTRNPASGSRGALPAPVGGMDPKLAEGLEAGRQIASGLQSLESLRASFGSVEGLGDVFHQPGNAGPGSQGGVRDPFGGGSEYDGGKVSNPLDRFSTAKPRDIRGGFSNSRRGNATTGLSRTGDRVLESEVSTASGRDGTSTPVQSTTHENGDVTASTTATTRDGNTTEVEVTEFSDGSGTSTTTHSNDGSTDTVTMTRRDSSGAVLWTRTDSVHAGGKQHIVTRDGSGRVTSDTTEYYTPGSRTCDRSPGEIAAGGPVNGTGPGVADAAGLMPLDLLRQFANGEGASGGTNTMTSGSLSSRHVNPDRNGSSGPMRNRLPVDSFGTISNPAPLGGEGAAGGGNRPD
ncbi:MAG TPA: hypothetical protein DIT64_00905 [Verrucomicrobiales bacterium]|nr:hypothetical protein [Verrucomicrobiales bacterium]